VVIIALEGSMAIPIDGNGNPILDYNLPQQPEITFGPFEGEKARRQDDPRGVIDGRHQTAGRKIWPKPGVGAAIPKDHPALLGFAFPALSMLLAPPLPLRPHPRRSPDLPHRLPTYLDPFLFGQLLGKMLIIKLPVHLLG
jgi:hypothetical protein